MIAINRRQFGTLALGARNPGQKGFSRRSPATTTLGDALARQHEHAAKSPVWWRWSRPRTRSSIPAPSASAIRIPAWR